MSVKGIVLAGGQGTRLRPITNGISKQLLPIYDKPMIYYALSVLMLAGIRDILIISTSEDLPAYKRLLGDGKRYGVSLQYKIQTKPNGIAEAFILAEKFIGSSRVALILGDNIFYGVGLGAVLKKAISRREPTIFTCQVRDPSRYGVLQYNSSGQPIDVVEKPVKPASNYAVTGLYFYDSDVIELAKSLKPSQRGELEISDVNKHYLKLNQIYVEHLGRGIAWLDTGTHSSLMAAGQFVYAIETSQGTKIACLEEISFNQGWLSIDDLRKAEDEHANTDYGDYLKRLRLEY